MIHFSMGIKTKCNHVYKCSCKKCKEQFMNVLNHFLLQIYIFISEFNKIYELRSIKYIHLHNHNLFCTRFQWFKKIKI